MQTQVDCEHLIQSGIVVAGKKIMLWSEMSTRSCETVNITLKDLLLHNISNEEVLEALKEVCPVQPEVRYSNMWHEGKPTTIQNGDRFVYIAV